MARSKGMTDRRILLKPRLPAVVGLAARLGGDQHRRAHRGGPRRRVPAPDPASATSSSPPSTRRTTSSSRASSWSSPSRWSSSTSSWTSCSPWSTRGLLVSESAVPYEPIEATHSVSTARPAPRSVGEGAVLTEVSGPRKHLGWFFWVCVGWIVLVILLAVFAALLPLPNPNYQNFASGQRGPSAATGSGSTT